MQFGRSMLAIALVLAATACGDSSITATDDTATPTSIAAGSITAERVSGGVRISNGSDQPVAYAVWNNGFLGLFGACATTRPDCPRLAPGASVTVPDGDIVGGVVPRSQASVRWWHVIPDGQGGFRTDEIREILVDL